MKLRLTLGLIGCTLLTILAPSIQPAQASLDFGTSRQLRTCPSRSGRLTVEQVKKYVACYYEEKAPYEASVKFVDVLSVQIAPKPRRVRYNEFRLHQIDIEKPIYEIRGSLIVYECRNITEGYPRGQNCSVFREPRSTGKCYQTTFGDWYCMMGGSASLLRPERKMPPPGSQETSSSGKPENNEPEPEQTNKITPNSAIAYNDSGFIKYHEKNDVQGALADFNRAIKINPNYADAYYHRGVIKNDNLDDAQGALADFNRALRINPNYGYAYYSRGVLKDSKLNDAQGALADFNRALRINPNHSRGYYSRGILKMTKLNDSKGALADLDQTVKINPNNAAAYHDRGILKKRYLNDSQGALVDMKQAAKLLQKSGDNEKYSQIIELLREWS